MRPHTSQDCVGARLVHKLRERPYAGQHGQRKYDDSHKSHHYLKEPWEAVRGTDEHHLRRDPQHDDNSCCRGRRPGPVLPGPFVDSIRPTSSREPPEAVSGEDWQDAVAGDEEQPDKGEVPNWSGLKHGRIHAVSPS
jgi:hypothetical protein